MKKKKTLLSVVSALILSISIVGAAIATSSMITEIANGKTVDEALEISRNDVAEALDGLPPVKMHCSNLAAGIN